MMIVELLSADINFVGSYINYIRDVIAKYNLQTDDVLRRMDLNRHSSPLNAHELKESLKMLDPSLNDYKALKLARDILKDRNKIEISDLIKELGCPPGKNIFNNHPKIEDDSHEHNDWYHTQLLAIKKRIKDISVLQAEFEVN